MMIRHYRLVLLLLICSFDTHLVSSWQLQPHHHHVKHHEKQQQQQQQQQQHLSRREWLTRTISGSSATAAAAATTAAASFLLMTTTMMIATTPSVSLAAPPIAIIAQELGYFPVTNSRGETVNVPKQVSRESTNQAIALAQYLSDNNTSNSSGAGAAAVNAKVYETYWCPHSARQRELFGRQAWAIINHIECSPKGYRAQPSVCLAATQQHQIDGYPTWILNNGKTVQVLGGERPLKELAIASGFPGTFDESLELNLPPMLGSSSCQ